MRIDYEYIKDMLQPVFCVVFIVNNQSANF